MDVAKEYEAAEGHISDLVNMFDINSGDDAFEKASMYRALGHFMRAVQKDMQRTRAKIESLENEIKKLKR